MRAALVYQPTGIATIRIADVEAPRAMPDQIIVEVHAASVNFPDILMAEGAYQLKPSLPFTPGMEAAGTIVEVGSNVRHFKPGDRVLASVEYGAFAERLAAPASRCFPIPNSISDDAAAAIGLAYQTAYFALLDRGQMRNSDVVLVNGATGGVGMATLRLAKALGARQVIASIGTRNKADLVREAGADAIVYVDTPDVIATLKDQIQTATNGHGIDLAVDPVGGDVFDASLRVLSWRGRIVVVGFASGRIPTVKANYPLLKNVAIIGLQWAAYPHYAPDEVSRAQEHIFKLFTSGRLDPNIGATYSLDQICTALEHMKQRRVHGKIVVRI